MGPRARKEQKIKDDFGMKMLLEKVDNFRGQCGMLLNYDWVNVPLVYTQVVTLAVYTFLMSTLMGHQYLDPAKKYDNFKVDLYFPIFTFLQFFFYMGWLKVAETLINPFGEDDDDFELNYLIDRHIKVGKSGNRMSRMIMIDYYPNRPICHSFPILPQ